MSIVKKNNIRRERRRVRTRSRLTSKSAMPRVSVFRSLNNISAQIIDDVARTTLVGFSSQQLSQAAGDKKTIARQVGIELAKRAHDKGITRVMFDRGAYLYHGRVKELAEGLREGGLQV